MWNLKPFRMLTSLARGELGLTGKWCQLFLFRVPKKINVHAHICVDLKPILGSILGIYWNWHVNKLHEHDDVEKVIKHPYK